MTRSMDVGLFLHGAAASSGPTPTGSRRKLIPFAAAFASAAFLFMGHGIQAETPIPQGGVYATLLAQEAEAPVPTPTRSRFRNTAIAALADYVKSIGGAVSERVAGQGAAPQDANHASAHATLRGEQVDIPDDSTHAVLRGAQPMGAVEPESGDETFTALRDYAERITGQEYQVAAAAKSAPARTKKLPDEGATYIGSQACIKCHAKSAEEYYKTLMGRIARTQKGKLDCESCHGPGSLHVAAGGGRGVGGMLNFKPDTPEKIEEINLICLGCHQKGGRTAWKSSTHETRGLACTNCHVVMRDITPKFQLAKQTEQETCYQCHKLQRAQMQRSSHMPVREGKMTCSNCHNPHGSVYGTEAMIREASINDNCYKCHAEKRGPYLWEHAPVRENCLNCHNPHGSNHENLLKVSRPRLCAECHGFAHGGQAGMGRVPPGNVLYSTGHSCANCHSQIHGSNHPSGTFFQR